MYSEYISVPGTRYQVLSHLRLPVGVPGIGIFSTCTGRQSYCALVPVGAFRHDELLIHDGGVTHLKFGRGARAERVISYGTSTDKYTSIQNNAATCSTSDVLPNLLYVVITIS